MLSVFFSVVAVGFSILLADATSFLSADCLFTDGVVEELRKVEDVVEFATPLFCVFLVTACGADALVTVLLVEPDLLVTVDLLGMAPLLTTAVLLTAIVLVDGVVAAVLLFLVPATGVVVVPVFWGVGLDYKRPSWQVSSMRPWA